MKTTQDADTYYSEQDTFWQLHQVCRFYITIFMFFTWKSRDRFLKRIVKGVLPQAQKINGVAYDNSYCHNAAPILFHLLDSYRTSPPSLKPQ